ncbi:hypothetical protein J2Y45_001528 [Dyadobacter sp. BE34]|uniref:Uncharacterized protein n=1 Tax=Dyadobacter fermentans TaxID=94254 RepID=A0ABU1QSW8_9BACT|nr:MULTISPECIES: hypothetical protein [Dyadobacter]MDR6804259.1 hypothetical protein [Dyadobacter fermentans]MDR7041999.1 hypothetical protein [Dyadobacter sp. BE242]MDR7196402.1 hypothetical protein [Dyadobacter sp. BE34]MDR7213053.1 hypothetical protein [Dyadobacter sp. BE31]MDR7261808.1 hypothetical protein [Dyadobacter sp. BE32]
MMIDEKLLVELFEQKDRKRREALVGLFREDLFASLTRARIADMINAKLGRPGLITAEDVRYCRFYFKDKKRERIHRAVEKTIRKPDQPQDAENIQASAFKVTNPDEIKLQDQFKFESKFAKKNET